MIPSSDIHSRFSNPLYPTIARPPSLRVSTAVGTTPRPPDGNASPASAGTDDQTRPSCDSHTRAAYLLSTSSQPTATQRRPARTTSVTAVGLGESDPRDCAGSHATPSAESQTVARCWSP